MKAIENNARSYLATCLSRDGLAQALIGADDGAKIFVEITDGAGISVAMGQLDKAGVQILVGDELPPPPVPEADPLKFETMSNSEMKEVLDEEGDVIVETPEKDDWK